MYGVWPAADRIAFLDAVTESYAQAAKESGGALVAVGDGWKAAWAVDPKLPLFGPDAFHPSPLGTYLAALVIYEAITNKDVRQTPTRAFAGNNEMFLSQETIHALQTAAHETVLQFR